MGLPNNVPVQVATIGLVFFLSLQIVLNFIFFNGVTVKLFASYLPSCKLDWKSNRSMLTCQAAVLVLGTSYSILILYYITSINGNTPEAIYQCAILDKLLGVVLFSCNFFIYQFLLLRAKAVELSKCQKWLRQVMFAFSLL